jgi:serine beta-lactamase-like protein LACTB
MLAGLVIVLSVPLVTWIGAPGLRSQRLDQVDQIRATEYAQPGDSATAWLKRVADSLRLPSISAAVFADGRIVWAAAIGHADLGRATPATLETRYRIGSVSKSLTTALLARLVAAGAVGLTDRVGEVFPGVPAAEATLEQLASHMGGVRHYTFTNGIALFREQFGQRHYATAASSVGLFLDDPLDFAPGAGFGYSTHGYTLLAATLERSAGADFLSLLARHVTGPLHLTATGADDESGPQPARAKPYREIVGRFFGPIDADPSYKWAGGGLLSTPSDLVRIGAALMHGEFVSPTMRESLWTVRRLPDGRPNPQGYGLGWRIEVDSGSGPDQSFRVVHHGGTSPGGSAFLLLLPESQVAFAVLTNRSIENPAALRDGARLLALRFAMAATPVRDTAVQPPPTRTDTK